ncbi:sensor histidine kinase [Streptacidiphilus jiangxiensis]|uniref:Sensor-like histidine kinase SenX3 n=1 Tax=Streptacidiphilus jiangxiensis TaxID=235985 RepID=A0A1H7TSK3_STRJI|nr:HAMP domain-containing sensor histidine kinase [Streptacidiphilus jiangxiensis]SEL87434.1 two-component system, OmpR family, sensor kinase [Streptacidiphilus jiangxiensis]
MNAPTRVRRLRRRLTALYALTSAVGLVGLATFAVHSDAVSRHKELDSSLNIATSQAMSGISYTADGKVDASTMLGYLSPDCPSLFVYLDLNHKVTRGYAPPYPCAHVADADLRAATEQLVRTNDAATYRSVRGTDGHPLRLYADAFDDDNNTTVGAVIAVADTSSDEAAHQHLELLLYSGCAVLVLISAVIGHLLSGRATRPALAAIRQQEEFLADTAHDLRSPAAALRGLAETALRDDSARDAALQRTVRLAGRMGELVDDLLTRARLSSGTADVAAEPVRLDLLVEAAAEDARASASSADTITLTAQPVIVTGDPALLRRAVGNLLGNALTHGHRPGEPAHVALTVDADGTVTVDDAGPGIPPGVAESLFERFRSGSGSTGLGLSIASWVARAHGGKLTAGPSPLGGARFTLRVATRR